MTLCPVALAIGCRRCAVFSVCPAKSVIGDYKPDTPTEPGPSKPASDDKGNRGR